jgi:hypothetical protein
VGGAVGARCGDDGRDDGGARREEIKTFPADGRTPEPEEEAEPRAFGAGVRVV